MIPVWQYSHITSNSELQTGFHRISKTLMCSALSSGINIFIIIILIISVVYRKYEIQMKRPGINSRRYQIF
jgi:hypothetical protein